MVSRDRLVDQLWGEEKPAQAAHTVQVFVSRLRKALGPEVIETKVPGYMARAQDLDLARFERLCTLGRDELERGRAALADRALAEALSLFRGPPLADFAYETWAQQEISRLEEARLACLEERIEAGLALGRDGELVGELKKLVAEYPLRERLHRQLMLALYRQGRQPEALEHYQQTRARLTEELGIEPSPELRELHRRVLNQDSALSHVIEGPPRRTLAGNLPTALATLIGRERELDELSALICRDGIRLTTVTGAGGAGKTGLALEVARRLKGAFPDGVFFVGLAPLSTPSSYLRRSYAQSGSPSGPTNSPWRPLLIPCASGIRCSCSTLRARKRGGQAACRAALATPELKVLVTSRVRLHLSGEHEYRLAPLIVPDHAEPVDVASLERYAAVRLFVARARAVRREFALTSVNAAAVAEICIRLDGLPLAIELAAARIAALSPEGLLDRLDQRLAILTGGARDVDERQRTLQATIEWSYGLLSEAEKRLFRSLSVFAGGCSYEAADQVCGADLDTLQGLVEKSLVLYADERYAMLETIREYADERLCESGEAGEMQRGLSDFSWRSPTRSSSDRERMSGSNG